VNFQAPDIDYAGFSPVLALTAGLVAVLMAGLFRRAERTAVPLLTLATLGTAAGLCIWQWGERKDLISGALRLDDLGLAISLICLAAAAVCVLLSLREPAAEAAGRGEYHSLLLGSVLGMFLIATAHNLITFFVALELLSIPLYILCASEVRRRASLEAGLKYLVVGSLGSATLLYGLAFIYGGSGSTDFDQIAAGIRENGLLGDPLVLAGVALAATGLAFKVSMAPFHQWTPDVYQGAPTPVTAFMAVATKAAGFAVFVRLFDTALGGVHGDWDGALAVIAAISIAVGNIGALGQDSLKRMLGYSGIAQAGYIMAGLLVFSELGLRALVFYLAVYLFMNLAAFAVVVARERETGLGDHIDSIAGIGPDRPLLAWPMTISMLSLAGFPATAGFIGKFLLIEASVDGDYTWLAVAIAVGTMISLGYYLRVVAAMWMRPDETLVVESKAPGEMPAIAGGAPQATSRQLEIVVPAVLAAAASVFFGVVPTPLIEWASDAAQSLGPLVP
jgi:NADH-quinone oxidoreductase subunit N